MNGSIANKAAAMMHTAGLGAELVTESPATEAAMPSPETLYMRGSQKNEPHDSGADNSHDQKCPFQTKTKVPVKARSSDRFARF